MCVQQSPPTHFMSDLKRPHTWLVSFILVLTTTPFLYLPAFIACTFSIFAPLPLLFFQRARLNSLNLQMLYLSIPAAMTNNFKAPILAKMRSEMGFQKKKYQKVSSPSILFVYHMGGSTPHTIYYFKKCMMFGVSEQSVQDMPPPTDRMFIFDRITSFLFTMLRQPPPPPLALIHCQFQLRVIITFPPAFWNDSMFADKRWHCHLFQSFY